MADKLMRAQVTIPMDTAIAKDAVTNVWHFDGDDVDEDDVAYHTAVMTMLTDFYQAIDGAVFPARIASPATVKIYDLRDPLPRVPEFTGTIALTPINDESYPSEVALCLSYQADPVSGISQARRRGRIYLGPFCFAARDLGSSDARPGATALNAIATAASALATPEPLPVTGNVHWAVYSPTTDVTASIDDAFNDVTNGWVDNAFDTQRRRGIAASARTLWT